MKSKSLPVGLVFAALLVLSTGLSAAQGPAPQGPGSPQAMLGSAFTYQGELRKDGNPVNATCTMAFRLYDDPAVGNPVGNPITLTVTVANGLFTAVLNSAGEFGLGAFSGEARWLEVAVQCPGDPAFGTLTPRQALTAAPYALSLQPGAHVAGVVDYEAVLHVTNNSTSTNAVGLEGQSQSPQSGIGVFGLASAASGIATGVRGETDSTEGYGVVGRADAQSGSTHGVFGAANSSAGIGVYGSAPTTGTVGTAIATSGTTYGVYGLARSTHGSGVYGWASAASGITFGVYGRSISTDGIGAVGYASATSGTTLGVNGQVDSSSGIGVYGLATATSGSTYGMWGQSNSTAGIGVRGYASAAGGTGYGVYGEAASPGGRGVVGDATAAWGITYGVYGTASSSSYGAAGVRGDATALDGNTCGVYGVAASSGSFPAGVYGEATAHSGYTTGVRGRAESPDGTGVWGEATASSGETVGVGGIANSTDGWGVYSYGNFGATGSKSAIVQTQGYGWRSLYSMESPEVLFEDVGTAQLVEGTAVVPIDPIFAQTVNLEKPYQVFLTAQGEGPVLLWVTAKTAESFTVRGVTLDGNIASSTFDYRIIAKRLGYEDVRLAAVHLPARIQQEWEGAPLPEEQP